MSFPEPFYKLTYGGGLYEDEIWSNSISLWPTSDPTAGGGIFALPTNAAEVVENLSVPIAQWIGSSNGHISNMANLKWVKLAALDTEGKYIGESALYEFDSPVSGIYTSSSGGNPYPQLTIALTFVTDNRRGLAAKGRIYPPLNAQGVDANGRVGSGVLNELAQGGAELITSLNAIAAQELNGAEVVVASGVREGAFNVVRGVQVGDVVDTQRSRRSAMREIYSDVKTV